MPIARTETRNNRDATSAAGGAVARTGMPFTSRTVSCRVPQPPSPASAGVALRADIVVIGAGQAGLSSAYHLKKRGLAPNRGFVVLDQAPTPGGAWQFRWPSLTLSTVNRLHDLPGMRFSESVDERQTEVEAAIARNLEQVSALTRTARLEMRYEKFRRMGVFQESATRG